MRRAQRAAQTDRPSSAQLPPMSPPRRGLRCRACSSRDLEWSTSRLRDVLAQTTKTKADLREHTQEGRGSETAQPPKHSDSAVMFLCSGSRLVDLRDSLQTDDRAVYTEYVEDASSVGTVRFTLEDGGLWAASIRSTSFRRVSAASSVKAPDEKSPRP